MEMEKYENEITEEFEEDGDFLSGSRCFLSQPMNFSSSQLFLVCLSAITKIR